VLNETGIGVTLDSLQNWEVGRWSPRARVALALADYLRQNPKVRKRAARRPGLPSANSRCTGVKIGNYKGKNGGRASETNKTIKRKNFIVMPIFKEEVEIDAPNQVGLVVKVPLPVSARALGSRLRGLAIRVGHGKFLPLARGLLRARIS